MRTMAGTGGNVSSTAYGGHDHKFIGEVPVELICSICAKVLRDPHLTGCCGQHFCESCLTHWFEKQKTMTCPHCRENLSHLLDMAMRRKINQLKVHCTLCEEGCEWEGDLSDLKPHLDSDEGCPYMKVECPNKCREMVVIWQRGDRIFFRFEIPKVRRMDLEAHLKSECSQRRYKCEYCDYEDTYLKITGGKSQALDCHYDDCPEKPQDCPNKCGAVDIKGKDVSTHREQCPMEPVQCPFEEAGYQTRLVRRDLDNHMTTQTQQHLLLTFQTTRMLRKRCEDLEKRNAELLEEN